MSISIKSPLETQNAEYHLVKYIYAIVFSNIGSENSKDDEITQERKKYMIHFVIFSKLMVNCIHIPYSGKFGGGKFGEFGELFVIRQTKTIQLSTYN